MKNIKTNIFLFAMMASSLTVNAQTVDEGDSLVVKKKVHVAFGEKDAEHLLGGISYVDMEELSKKDYTMSSLEDMYALVGGWNGNNLWGMDNDRLDTNDNGNLPLVIIDGVKRPSNNVLPSEIEQITFLKGAQAVILYGAKGAKGAILITTKRGKVDGLQINVNANTGFHVAKEFPEYLGSAEYMTLYNEARLNDGKDLRYSQMDIYNHAVGLNPYRYPNVNYYSDDYVRKVYNRSDATVEIQGGGQRAHFYTNINYYRFEDLINFGPAKDNYTDRFSVRGNVDLVVNRVVKGYANASATFYNAHKNKGNFWGEAATMRPNFPENAAPLLPLSMVDPNGSKALSILGKSLNLLDGKFFPGGTKTTQSNAIADCYFGGKTRDVSRQFQFDAGIIYDMNNLVKGLSFKTLFSIDYAANYSLSYNNKYAVFIPTWSNYNSQDAIVALTQQGDEIVTGTMTMSDSKYRQTISWNGHFDYDNIFAGKHHVTGMLLANMFTTTTSGQYHRYANANLGLQVGYDFMKRYFAEVSFAGVHSARLPKGNREALSHSFTLGWNMAEEDFMKGSFVDDLMLSASYSNLNEDMDVYMSDDYDKNHYLYVSEWANDGPGYTWNDASRTTSSTYSKSGVNPSLGFVHRKEFSVNLRGSFFNKLISTDISFFNTDMTGLIIQNPTTFPSYLSGGLNQGTFKPTINNNIQNRKGIDFSITAQKQFGKLYAALGVVGTYLKTNYKKYDELVEYDYQHVEGQPLDAMRGYRCLGFYTANDFNYDVETGKITGLKSELPRPSIGGTIRPGDLKYEDVNGDGSINDKDQVVIGKWGTYGSPFTMGVNLTLKYDNFTLFVVGNGQFGANGMKNNGNSYYYMSGDAKYSVNARGRWTPETAEIATHPRLTTDPNQNNAAPSTFWIYSTNRFNLRKVQLTYDFPQEMFKGKWVKELSVYINGNDLLTIAKERKLLETSIGSAPQTRFYNLGVKVTL
ncbi:MAG: SusC/RagA family TonB-linked outer membrane protein [Prevotella sp.]|nr:SusC/RagA family TonB-linked outer membrane protein [Prevotella sp.]